MSYDVNFEISQNLYFLVDTLQDNINSLKDPRNIINVDIIDKLEKIKSELNSIANDVDKEVIDLEYPPTPVCYFVKYRENDLIAESIFLTYSEFFDILPDEKISRLLVNGEITEEFSHSILHIEECEDIIDAEDAIFSGNYKICGKYADQIISIFPWSKHFNY